MDLSLFYFVFVIFTLLPAADQTEFNLDSCPTSRRLLFFGKFNFSLGEKKSGHVSSYIKESSSVKHTQKEQKPGVKVYVQPQTSAELGHKVRSFSYLLKPKLVKEEERTKPKKIKVQKKKSQVQKTIKKKNTTQHNTKTRDLVAVNDEERQRCRALLHIDQKNTVTHSKDAEKTKKQKKSKSSKKNNVTMEAKKKLPKSTKSLPVDEKQKPSKVKSEKTDKKSTSNDKKKPINKPSETEPVTASTTVNQESTKSQKSTPVPPKASAPPSPPPPPPPPASTPPISQSSANTKSKREKTPSIIRESIPTSDADDSINIDHHEKNNSVVDRAYHFVRNMFQLSDDMLDNNNTHEDDQILSSINEEQHRQSRKLLSMNDQEIILNGADKNNWNFDELNDKQSFVSFNDLSLSYVNILKRQLLSVKKNKRSIPTEASYVKTKRSDSAANKPKVGWAYRYRISRYLADQHIKRSSHARKPIGGGQHHSQPIQKKLSSSMQTKLSKRKLLGITIDDESDSDSDDTSNEDIVNTVSITQEFVPKRQLFASKKVKDNHEDETDEDDDIEKVNERRRMKSFDELTDPVEIVRSYERGLFKPRVGWQFRYRVSRYIDSLRENIREDQERLKLGLEAIKRKTPQELSGRRKRVLDKPFASEVKEEEVPVEDSKPNVGWRYRYRISKMLEAKARGEYIDDEEEKRKARLDQKLKQTGLGKSTDDDECIEWEYDHLDPELRKINEGGRRVGWAYRYRIRRKLDDLKRQQAESGIAFDLETLTSELDKKEAPTPSITKDVPAESPVEVNRKSVGWKYRYRVSKMLEAQQREAFEAQFKGKTEERIPLHERLDPELARLTPEERAVGWQYRYRIRRKLDAIKNATRESQAGKRSRKHGKDKEKIIKKVEESIEKILNIDDIDETPFMEYFRRTSSYILFGLMPTGRKSICLLPLPIKFSFCDEDDEVQDTLTTTTTVKPLVPTSSSSSSSSSSESVKPISTKKVRTKKEKRPIKQSMPSRSIKFAASAENIAAPVKPVTKAPVKTIGKPQKKPSRERLQVSTRFQNDEQIKHYDEEEEPIRKLVGVESQKNKNKKRFQIIGKEVKIKAKHSATTTTTTTTTMNPPPVSTIASTPMKTTKSSSTVKTPALKPSSTTTPAPLRSISEIIQEEAATFVSTKPTYPEEAAEEINEANESLQATITTTIATTTPSSTLSSSPATSNLDDDTMSDEDDSESTSSDTDSDSESTSAEDSNENDDNSDDISPIKKIQQIYESAKESMHDVFDLQDEKDSS